MQAFDIQVFNRKTKKWQHKTTKDAKRGNDALKDYGLRGSRPYTKDGITFARSNSGKTFRAVPEVTP